MNNFFNYMIITVAILMIIVVGSLVEHLIRLRQIKKEREKVIKKTYDHIRGELLKCRYKSHFDEWHHKYDDIVNSRDFVIFKPDKKEYAYWLLLELIARRKTQLLYSLNAEKNNIIRNENWYK